MVDTPREQLVKLQALMKEQQTEAVVTLQGILDSAEMTDLIEQIKGLRESFIPGSAEESQLDAIVNVYGSVKGYFEAVYPVFVTPTEPLPAPPAA